WSAVTSQTGKMFKTLFSGDASPLVWPRLIGALWIIGAVRVMLWARRHRRWLVGALIVTSPAVLAIAVIASSGQWAFHNYRYIAPAFPLIAVTAACALAPVELPRVLGGDRPRWARAIWPAGAAVLVALLWRAALPAMRADIALFAQNAADLNLQVVTLGQYIHRKLPDASIMFHDAGA